MSIDKNVLNEAIISALTTVIENAVKAELEKQEINKDEIIDLLSEYSGRIDDVTRSIDNIRSEMPSQSDMDENQDKVTEVASQIRSAYDDMETAVETFQTTLGELATATEEIENTELETIDIYSIESSVDDAEGEASEIGRDIDKLILKLRGES